MMEVYLGGAAVTAFIIVWILIGEDTVGMSVFILACALWPLTAVFLFWVLSVAAWNTIAEKKP